MSLNLISSLDKTTLLEPFSNGEFRENEKWTCTWNFEAYRTFKLN